MGGRLIGALTKFENIVDASEGGENGYLLSLVSDNSSFLLYLHLTI